MGMQARNTVAHGTGKLEYTGPCAAVPTMDCTGNWEIGKGQAIRKYCRHGGKGRQASG